MNIAEFIRSLLAYHKTTERAVRRKFQEINLRSKVFRPQFEAAKGILSASYAKLTPYACQEISRQLDKLHGQVLAYDADSNTLAVSRNGEEIHYSVGDTCQCLHFIEKQLPCWHVLAYCQFANKDPLLNIPQRYLKERLVRCFEGVEEDDGGVVSGQIHVIEDSRERSEWEKRMIMKEACRELVAVGVRCGQRVFEQRMQSLRRLMAIWRQGEDVEVEDVLEYADDMVEMERSVQVQERVDFGGVRGVSEEELEEDDIGVELVCPEMERGVDGQEAVTAGGDDVADNTVEMERSVQVQERLDFGAGVVEDDIGAKLVCPEMERGVDRQEVVTAGGDDVAVRREIVTTIAEVHSYGDRLSISYGEKERCYGKFEKVKMKGRPRGAGVTCSRKKRTVCRPIPKSKRMKTVAVSKDICGVCGEEELAKDLCEGGAIMEWIDCDGCHQWFHSFCAGFKGGAVAKFFCTQCKS